MRSEALRRAQQRYFYKMYPFAVRLKKKKDFAIIKKIEQQPNKTDYLRELVMRDIRFGRKR